MIQGLYMDFSLIRGKLPGMQVALDGLLWYS